AGPGALLAALERTRSGRMRDIVATVQKEQDEVIRAPLSGVLVVQGGPGTGKTAVALHRAAYLLYTHRFPLERQGVLVIGPHRLRLSRSASAAIVATVRRRGGTHNSRRRQAETLVHRHLFAEYERAEARIRRVGLRVREDGETDEAPQAANDEVEFADFARTMRRDLSVATTLDYMWPLLTPQQLLHDLFGAPPLI